MYTWEIEKFLREHNRIITRDEFYDIVNQVDNPQVKDVKYDTKHGDWIMRTDDDGAFVFKVR